MKITYSFLLVSILFVTSIVISCKKDEITQPMTGIWNYSISPQLNGTINLTQHNNNSLSGSITGMDGINYQLLSSSKITGNLVILEWTGNGDLQSLQGAVNAACDTLEGTLYWGGVVMGAFEAKKQ